MFQDVLLFELFQRALPNPFLFSFKSTRQNLQVRKKRIALGPSHSAREGNTLFLRTSSFMPKYTNLNRMMFTPLTKNTRKIHMHEF